VAEAEGEVTLHLERDLVKRLYDPTTGYEKQVMAAQRSLSLEDAYHPETEEVLQVESTNAISKGDGLEENPLEKLGIPPYEILKISVGSDMKFYSLRGDRQRALGPLAGAAAAP